MIETCAAQRYLPAGRETDLFQRAFESRLPVMLLGPTGCGKTRLVEHMAAVLERRLVTITCHDDLTTGDLVGRHLISGGDVVWHDGPLTAAVRTGAICYLDEIVEARPDTLAMLHSLADHRRTLFLERLGEELMAPDEFMLVASYNPRPGASVKDLKPSLRQRFATIRLGYLLAEEEAAVVAAESHAPPELARRLVDCAAVLREAADRSPHTRFDPPSTRSLVAAATVMAGGTSLAEAVEAFLVAPLATDPALEAAIRAVASAALRNGDDR